MDVGRKGLFHADRRTAPADVARHGQQLLHRNQIDLLVARDLRRGFQIDLVVARHDADEITRAVAFQHEGLEDAGDILAQLFGDVRRGEVLFVPPVRNQFVCDPRAVEQPRGIRLFDFGMCPIVPFIFLSAAKVF